MSSYIFEKEQLSRLLADFYTAVGVAAVLYDADGTEVVKTPMYAATCAALREMPAFRATCDRSDAVHLAGVRESGDSIRYLCHAGMCEVIKPVYYEGVPIAFLQIGQFRLAGCEEEGEACLTAAARACGYPAEVALTTLRRMPVVSHERLAAIEGMMDVIIRSLWADGLIKARRSMRSVRILREIEERLAEPIRIPELAAAHGLSRHALYRLFAEELGTTPTAYITARRLLRAAAMLTEGDAPIAAVAAAVGFDDYSYFIRLFRREYAMTPLAYRREHRKK